MALIYIPINNEIFYVRDNGTTGPNHCLVFWKGDAKSLDQGWYFTDDDDMLGPYLTEDRAKADLRTLKQYEAQS